MMYNLVSAACLVLFVIPKGAPASPTQGRISYSLASQGVPILNGCRTRCLTSAIVPQLLHMQCRSVHRKHCKRGH